MSGHTPLPPTLIELPMLPLRDVVVFPHMVIPLFVGRPKSIKALESAMAAERRIMLVAQKTAAKDEPGVEDMFDVGCVSTILQMLKLPDGTVKVLVEGQQRALVKSIVDGEVHFVASVNPVDPVTEQSEASSEIEALRRAVMQHLLDLRFSHHGRSDVGQCDGDHLGVRVELLAVAPSALSGDGFTQFGDAQPRGILVDPVGDRLAGGLEHGRRPVLIGETLAEVHCTELSGQGRHLGEDVHREGLQTLDRHSEGA